MIGHWEQVGTVSSDGPQVGFWDSMRYAGNFANGAGEMLTFGAVGAFNRRTGADSVIDWNSSEYTAGQVTGVGVGIGIGVGGGATAAALANGRNGALFGRGGAALFNRGWVRFGWGWKGSATAGRDVIRLGIGAARGTKWWNHIPFYYP